MRKLYGCHRKGSAALRVAALTVDGTVTAAALVANDLDVAGTAAIDGAVTMGSTATVVGVLSVADGAVGTPGIAFASDPNTGIYRPGVDQVALTAGGAYGVLATSGSQFLTGSIYVGAAIVPTPTAVQTITAVGDAITATGTHKRLSSNATRTLTSVPTIAAGQDGQELVLVYEGANTLTLQDLGTLAGSNLKLGAAARALSAGDVLSLRYSAGLTRWVETGFANNV